MAKDNPRKRLTDYIDIERDILPYNVTAIYAGTNAGKTTLIEGYHSENVNFEGLAQKCKVLFITSRKQKVTQTYHQQDSFLKDLRDVGAIIHGKGCNKNVVCTNAHVHQYVSKYYCKDNELTYFWRYFDFVVVDEIHSICTDSAFAQCSYTLKGLIEKIVEEQKSGKTKTKLLLMTATPQPIEWFVQQINAKVYDFTQALESIKPTNISVVTKQYIQKEVIGYVKASKTVVYYFSHLNGVMKVLEQATSNGVAESEIAIAISDKDMVKKVEDKYPTIFANSDELDDSVNYDGKIPNHFKLIITNGKWREAINVRNIVDYLVIESHYPTDIQQIVGRFRNGVKKIYLVEDAQQFGLYNSFDDEWGYYSDKVTYDNAQLQKRKSGVELPKKYQPILEDAKAEKFISSMLKQSKYSAFNLLNEMFEPNMAYKKFFDHYSLTKSRLELYLSSKSSLGEMDDYFKGIEISYETEDEGYARFIEELFYSENIKLGETSLSRDRFIEIVKILQINLKKFETTINYKQYRKVLKRYGCDYEHKGKSSEGTYIIYQFRAQIEPPKKSTTNL